MSALVPCSKRSAFDKYATAKSNAEMFLTGGLLADSIKDLYDLANRGQEIDEKLWYILLIIVCILILFELTGIILSIILASQRYPCSYPDGSVETGPIGNRLPPPDELEDSTADKDLPKCAGYLRPMNDALTAITFILMVVIGIKNALYSDTYNSQP